MGLKVILLDEEKQEERFTCPSCSQLLDVPYQAACGDRYCGTCYKALQQASSSVNCHRCNETLNTKEFFKDSACQRELNQLLVGCGWGQCQWNGQYGEFKKHQIDCLHVTESCECGHMISRQEMTQHRLTCPCDQVERDGRNKHDLGWLVEQLTQVQHSMVQLQTQHSDLVLMVQSLQATSYDGNYIWKVPEVSRRYRDAKEGKTLSLYSAPFYTSRHGYRLCLRVYLNGDGTGHATHVSFFLTIMKGEFDALLQWPFQRVVRLCLRSQSPHKKDIRHCFKPDGLSSSFMKPQHDMNLASGCPQFAPVSVLQDGHYVQDDVMFLQCEVDSNNEGIK